MHRPHWQKVAILFSAAWIVVVGVSTGVYAYRQFACKPTVELLADGTHNKARMYCDCARLANDRRNGWLSYWRCSRSLAVVLDISRLAFRRSVPLFQSHAEGVSVRSQTKP